MIKRIWNTIRYLRASQFFYRLKKLFGLNSYKLYRGVQFQRISLFIHNLHDDADYLNRFGSSTDRLSILHLNIPLSYEDIDKYLPLVRYNIEYFEYSICWAQKGVPFSAFKDKWNEYLKCNRPLEPYIVSLQVINIFIAMSIYDVFDQEIIDELYSRYRWLIKHQEKHLLANHYFENLKTILICSKIFGEDSISKRYLTLLRKECEEQILGDGIHFELSLMYHKIILEDLMLVYKVFKEKWIADFVEKMLKACSRLEEGFCRTPLFNDAGDNVAKPIHALNKSWGSQSRPSASRFAEFNDSGYYKIYDKGISILIDAGPLGPSYNPGHSHCDCLSFELFVGEEPLFVNSGTFQYQGDKRSYFRSTSAHNTMIIDGHEQSDCWGAHRVGKRIKNAVGNLNSGFFSGSFISQYGEECLREISLFEGTFTVLDSFKKAQAGKPVKSFLHLAPGYSINGNRIVGRGKEYEFKPIDCTSFEEDSYYSPEFGRIEKNKCLVFSWELDERKHGYSVKLIK